MVRTMPSGLTLVVHTLVLTAGMASAQTCRTSDLDQMGAIAPICCENSGFGADCSGGFPTVCTRECSDLARPFWTSCSGLISLLGDIYPSDETALANFIEGPCEDTNTLFEHAILGACEPTELDARINDVNAACCTQGGICK
jgi:hypothetical protein